MIFVDFWRVKHNRDQRLWRDYVKFWSLLIFCVIFVDFWRMKQNRDHRLRRDYVKFWALPVSCVMQMWSLEWRRRQKDTYVWVFAFDLVLLCLIYAVICCLSSTNCHLLTTICYLSSSTVPNSLIHGTAWGEVANKWGKAQTNQSSSTRNSFMFNKMIRNRYDRSRPPKNKTTQYEW